MREYPTREQLLKFSFSKIERLQNARFSATCRHLLPLVPFYKILFKQYGVDPEKLNRVEDWHTLGLPLIKKATYMKKPLDFVVKPGKDVFVRHVTYLDHQTEYKTAFDLLFSGDKRKHLKDYYTPKMLIFSGGTESGNPTPVLLTATQKFDIFMNIIDIAGQLIMNMSNFCVAATPHPCC